MVHDNLFRVLLYYKYNEIKNTEEFAKEHREFCKKRNLVGRVLISKEGINGTCAGKPEDILKYKDYVHSLEGFRDLLFKEHAIDFLPFKKLKVMLKDEIVCTRFGVDLNRKGEYLSPEEFNSFFEKSKNDKSIVFFDARNEIESKVGRFRNAVTPKIKFFRELKDELKNYAHLKDKKIVLYCTGGIRCEKASSLFLQDGFKEVYQLEGGIYNYLTKFPNGFFDGTCFVFDDRMQIVYDDKGDAVFADNLPEEKVISSCDFCGKKSARIVNDERQSMRCLVVCCEDCDREIDVSRVRFRNAQLKT